MEHYKAHVCAFEELFIYTASSFKQYFRAILSSITHNLNAMET